MVVVRSVVVLLVGAMVAGVLGFLVAAVALACVAARRRASEVTVCEKV